MGRAFNLANSIRELHATSIKGERHNESTAANLIPLTARVMHPPVAMTRISVCRG